MWWWILLIGAAVVVGSGAILLLDRGQPPVPNFADPDVADLTLDEFLDEEAGIRTRPEPEGPDSDSSQSGN